MEDLQFPQPYQHSHKPVIDINKVLESDRTFGQRAADWVAGAVGSWKFLVTQSFLLAIWFALNTMWWIYHWDPYPFIFMNLILSLQSAYTASVVMISENRQNERDRLASRNEFDINQKTEEEVRAILEHLTCQDRALIRIHEQLKALEVGGQAERRSKTVPEEGPARTCVEDMECANVDGAGRVASREGAPHAHPVD